MVANWVNLTPFYCLLEMELLNYYELYLIFETEQVLRSLAPASRVQPWPSCDWTKW